VLIRETPARAPVFVAEMAAFLNKRGRHPVLPNGLKEKARFHCKDEFNRPKGF
jgi:hypothetical protein